MALDIDGYYQHLATLATRYAKREQTTHHFLEDLQVEEPELVAELVQFRKTFMGEAELDEVRPFLVIGYFRQYHDLERATLFKICFELNEMATKLSWRQRCAPYAEDQPLFVKAPTLFAHRHNEDLIHFSCLEQVDDSEVLRYGNLYTHLDFALNPGILSWTRAQFPNKELFVRAIPFHVFDQRPPQRLYESILMPANPMWWRQLTLHKRQKEGACYELDDCSPKENLQQYWELHVKQVKRLEVIAKRNNSGNLSMMLEEITTPDNHGLVFGRCIHLDTDAAFGTAFGAAKLNHLDLAINVYEGEDATKRLQDRLSDGAVTTDASYRTHLLKVLDIPFTALLDFVPTFFQSKTLINEWFTDQFGNIETGNN